MLNCVKNQIFIRCDKSTMLKNLSCFLQSDINLNQIKDYIFMLTSNEKLNFNSCDNSSKL